jgi:hypothetical protein
MTAEHSKFSTSIEGAPRNSYIAELHVQIIKYADVLQNVTGKNSVKSWALALLLVPSLRRCGKLPQGSETRVSTRPEFNP